MGKLDPFKGRITVIPGATNDREVIRKAVAGCDGVLTAQLQQALREGLWRYAVKCHHAHYGDDRRRSAW